MNSVGKHNRAKVCVVLAAPLVLTALGCSNSAAVSSTDIQAIKAASQAYGTAWLSNDPELVMATLTDDAVVIPSGSAPIEGQEAIREFWWPKDSPPTTVTEFTSTQDEVGGHGDFGFVRGTFSLRFDYDGTGYSGAGTYISLLRRLPDGSWRISHRMWSDRPPPRD